MRGQKAGRGSAVRCPFLPLTSTLCGRLPDLDTARLCTPSPCRQEPQVTPPLDLPGPHDTPEGEHAKSMRGHMLQL